MKDKSKVSKKEIELINSYGPFNHSRWEGKGVRVSNEDYLVGRADFLVEKIKEILQKNFSRAEMKKMTIADVGAYDGWVLHQLSELPFKKLIAIEPRRKNILKGEKVRKILGIKSRVEFIRGDLASLKGKKFDTLLCLGLLHHVESISSSIKQLDAATERLLVIDTICMPSSYITDDFKRDVEMKDVIYRQKPKICGFTAQKYESSYNDGSASETTVVNVPSVETLLMELDILGYKPIKISAGPGQFKKVMKKNPRPFREVLLYGVKNDATGNSYPAEYIKNYEAGLLKTNLKNELIKNLYEVFCLRQKNKADRKLSNSVIGYVLGKKDASSLKNLFPNQYAFEIVKNLRFNPADKIKLEYGKLLIREKRLKDAVEVFKEITQKLNADWRAVYRSFYFLYSLNLKQKKEREAKRYQKLCLSANPLFPLFNRHGNTK